MKSLKSGFTMMELIFVIVVLGILSAIAIPRLAVTRDDATTAKIRADLSAIQSGIALRRSQNLMRGVVAFPALGANCSNVLSKPITPGNGRNGITQNGNILTACVAGNCATFRYYQSADGAIPAGTFRCESGKCNLFK